MEHELLSSLMLDRAGILRVVFCLWFFPCAFFHDMFLLSSSSSIFLQNLHNLNWLQKACGFALSDICLSGLSHE